MIKVVTRGIPELTAFIKSLPHGTKVVGIKAVTEYIEGDDRHGLKHLVPYKYVSRKSAYGQTFVSDKQRRYVMMMINLGVIKPGQDNRTGATTDAWNAKFTNRGYSATLSNASQGAKFIMGDDTQARQPAMVGHRKVSDVISTNIKGAMQAAMFAVQKWIKQHSK